MSPRVSALMCVGVRAWTWPKENPPNSKILQWERKYFLSHELTEHKQPQSQLCMDIGLPEAHQARKQHVLARSEG